MKTVNTKMPEFKVVFVGDAHVGKTSIIMRYHHDVFNEDAPSTIGAAFITKQIQTQHGMASFNIWDTAGQERYRSLVPMYSRNAFAAVIVIDLSEMSSFEGLDSWLESVKQDVSPSCYIIIAGNKCDLPNQVPLDKIKAWAEKNGVPYLSVSAKTGQGINDLFSEIAASMPESFFKPQEVPALNQNRESSCC